MIVDYELLSDAEWQLIEAVVHAGIQGDRQGKQLNRQPQKKSRALTNAVLQSIATGVALINVEHPDANYSSWPTRGRFKRILYANDHELLIKVIKLLAGTRPDLLAQFEDYQRRPHAGGRPPAENLQKTWGYDLSPLPFWDSSSMYRVDDGDGY